MLLVKFDEDGKSLLFEIDGTWVGLQSLPNECSAFVSRAFKQCPFGFYFGDDHRLSPSCRHSEVPSKESEALCIHLTAVLYREQLTQRRLAELEVEHILPEPLAEHDPNDLFLETQIRSAIVGDVPKIRGGLPWRRVGTDQYAWRTQGTLLGHYNSYLRMCGSILSELLGAENAESFIYTLLSTSFIEWQNVGKENDDFRKTAKELVSADGPKIKFRKPNQKSHHSLVKNSSKKEIDPFTAFLDRERMLEARLANLLEHTPDEEIRQLLLGTIEDARKNRWAEFMNAMLTTSSNSNDQVLDKLRELLGGDV